jgi:hypothetical protein
MGYGLWVWVWVMGYGLWVMGYGLCRIIELSDS